VSRRWSEPEYVEEGGYWTARLSQPPTPGELAMGVEPHAFGPDRAACIRETRRLDALWAWLPMRRSDVKAVERRRAYLRGEGDGRC
jgi:hypothetical protein